MGEPSALTVHRCRFIDYIPAAITAVAFPPLPPPSSKGKQKASASTPKRIAQIFVGRANGNIEVYDWTGSQGDNTEAPQAWVVRKTLAGPYPSKVDSLAIALRNPWRLKEGDTPNLRDVRVFSTGGGSELLEWDMESEEVRRAISSTGGSIWSIAVNPASTKLALGCEDGTIQILSIENDALFLQQRLDRSKSRVLSLAWGSVTLRLKSKATTDTSDDDDDDDDDDENDEWADTWLVAGCSDSSLRKYDLATGQIVERMSTDKVRGERTLVWTVGVLGDGTIISGDSLGAVKFWDSQTCTQLQSVQAHGADVLCLTIGPDGANVYSSGVDQKIVQFSRIKTTSSEHFGSTLSKRWAQIASKRMHSHDVRALAIWPPYTPVPLPHSRNLPADFVPILVSGGLDMSLVATPIASPQATTRAKLTNPLSTSVAVTFEDAYHRRLAYSSGFYGATAIHLARHARLLLCIQDTSATLWRIPGDVRDAKPGENSEDFSFEEVLRMDFSVKTNIVASAISDDGTWLAISDHFETKLFSLSATVGGDIKPRRVRDFATAVFQADSLSLRSGASSLRFSPDSSKLIIGNVSAHILIIDLGKDRAPLRLLRRFTHHSLNDTTIGERVIKNLRQRRSDRDTDINIDEPGLSSSADFVSTTIIRMAVSLDGQWLATTDDRRRTHVFNLDSLQHHSLLPSFPQPVQAIAFSPTAALLVLGFADNTFELWDVEARRARRFYDALPKRFTHLHDPILGVALPPVSSPASDRTGSFVLFWGATWLCKVDFTADTGSGEFDKKRRRQSSKRKKIAGGENFKLFTQYRQLLLADFASERELVVVERPLVDVLARLPPAYFKPKYGVT